MNTGIKNMVRKVVPPILVDVYRYAFRRTGFFGNYRSWDEARKASVGYDSELILEKVKTALLKVKNGEAVYERDSVLFDRIQYSWPLLAALLWIASRNDNRLDVVDFGGSLGSSYFQNRQFLGHLSELRWNVIEQKNFVDCGRRHFEDEKLRFYYSLEECLGDHRPHVMLLSSVLPYLNDPYAVLGWIIERQIEYIILDRTPVLEDQGDRLTVQRVPKCIYPASYPAWFLNKQRLLGCFAGHYDLIAEFEALDGRIPLRGASALDSGFIFRLKGGGA